MTDPLADLDAQIDRLFAGPEGTDLAMSEDEAASADAGGPEWLCGEVLAVCAGNASNPQCAACFSGPVEG